MDTNTRLLALIAEFILVPAQTEDKKIRAVFDKVSDTHAIVSYSSAGPGSVVMSSKEEKSDLIKYRIMPDRIVLSYEFCSKSMQYYMDLADDFVKVFSSMCGIHMSVAHSIIIRKLVNITGVRDAREFMLKGAFGVSEDNLKVFGRPLHMFGTRFFFPPLDQAMPLYEAKVESSMEDPSTLFVECKGTMARQAALKDGIAGAKESIAATDTFMNNNITGFFTQFLGGGK